MLTFAFIQLQLIFTDSFLCNKSSFIKITRWQLFSNLAEHQQRSRFGIRPCLNVFIPWWSSAQTLQGMNSRHPPSQGGSTKQSPQEDAGEMRTEQHRAAGAASTKRKQHGAVRRTRWTGQFITCPNHHRGACSGSAGPQLHTFSQIEVFFCSAFTIH